MVKDYVNGEPGSSDAAQSAKLVFSDDAHVVNYLNALLASAPALNTESAEIQFVHMANGVTWNPVRVDSGHVGAAKALEVASPGIEGEWLRSENERLKFKAELAEIDSQVLRGEIENLKSEIAVKAEQLREMKVYLNEVINQNIEFQSKIDQLRIELDLSTAEKINSSLMGLTGDFATDEEIIEEEVVPEPEIEEPLEDAAVFESQEEVVAEEQRVEPVVESVPIVPEQAATVLRPSVSEIREVRGVDEDTALISRPQPVVEKKVVDSVRETVVASRTESAITVAPRIKRPDSKVLKSDELKVVQNPWESRRPEEPHRQVEIVAPPRVSQKEEVLGSAGDQSQAPLQPEPTQEAESGNKEDVAAPVPIELPRDCTDEIDMEAAPDPKIVVRRNVKLYQDIQSVTDTGKAVVEAHEVVL